MSPDFTALLLTSIAFGTTVLGFMAWRFGGANMMVFVVMTGLFPAVMDFLSSFVSRNYEYPGQSRLWVFSYIFFGWIGVCGTCMLLAEGILARPREDLLSQLRLLWQVPVAAGIIAVGLDLFIDPVAVVAGYWGMARSGRGLLWHPVAQLRGLVRADVSGSSCLDPDCQEACLGLLAQGGNSYRSAGAPIRCRYRAVRGA
jgi:hypothetical protein